MASNTKRVVHVGHPAVRTLTDFITAMNAWSGR